MTEERAEYTVHADTITEQKRRIAELEATVARLEQDNRRLRHLDAMPVDAMRRYMTASMYDTRANGIVSAEQFDADNVDICTWLDGDA